MKTADLSGQRFGKLLVISRARNRRGNAFWNCKCDCGTEHEISSYCLRKGPTISCPTCANRVLVDLTGRRFGKLTVTSRAFNPKYKRSHWNCICDCGAKLIVTANNLNFSTKSCFPCTIRRLLDETLASKHALYSAYKTNARNNHHSFSLTFEEFINETQKNCSYCGDPPSQYFISTSKGIFYNGLDRLDSEKDYTLDNVIPCCKKCNFLKGRRNKYNFIAWLKKCYANLNLREL